jgi:hypothetical protein
MHQKLGTFNWYNPRWIGNIACITDINVYFDPNHGNQITINVTKTIKKYIANYPIILFILCLPYFLIVNPIKPAKKAGVKYTAINLLLTANV